MYNALGIEPSTFVMVVQVVTITRYAKFSVHPMDVWRTG